ncbi:MAG: hypothetical protein ACJAU6_000205 [Alphaproteobacteria bacterium]|jgi:hypothetical protein
MTVSQNKRPSAFARRYLFLVGAIAALAPIDAIAAPEKEAAPLESSSQETLRPESLTPETLTPETLRPDAPLRLTPKSVVDAARENDGVPAAVPAPGSAPLSGPGVSEPRRLSGPVISVDLLDTLDPESVGTLDQNTGGLGVDMWAGTPRSFIERLIPLTPNRLASPTLRKLARRLLLSTAIVPPFAVNHVADGARGAGSSLVAARVERLKSLGDIEGSMALIEAAPTRDDDPLLLRYKAENLLVSDDRGGACAEAFRQQDRVEDTFWQQLVIYCQILQGNVSEAALGASLLAETSETEDTVFAAIVDSLFGAPSEAISSLRHPTPLRLSMLRSANLPLPDDALGTSSSSLLRMMALSPNASLETRLEAAERAARYGAISADRLAQIYAATEFTPTALDNALSLARDDRTPRGRALLYRAGLANNVPAKRAEILKLSFDLALEGGHYGLAVITHEPVLHTLSAAMKLPWFAATAARALYAIDRPFPARSWLESLRIQASGDKSARAAMESLWAMTRLSGNNFQFDDGVELRWLSGLKAQSANAGTGAGAGETIAAQRRIGGAYILFQALGEPLNPAGWRREIGEMQREQAVVPEPLYRFALRDAARERRVGETILLSLIVMGEDGPGDADISVIGEVISSLLSIGLANEARALAIETALNLRL